LHSKLPLTAIDYSTYCVYQERNSLGAVKAVTAAQLSMASDGIYSVTLDEAIEAMRLTAADMSVKYKETSLSVCSLFIRS
jgi:L-serine deaminase